jgi:hypothetical protein
MLLSEAIVATLITLLSFVKLTCRKLLTYGSTLAVPDTLIPQREAVRLHADLAR